MKQKTINTGTCQLLFAELPDNVRFYKSNELKTKQGNWQLLSRADKVTEDVAKEVVLDSLDMGFFDGNDYYKDYSGEFGNIDDFDDFFDTALESYNSLLLANQIYFENPAGENPHAKDDDAGTEKELKQIEWNNFQQNVWDKTKTYIFKKIE